MNHQMDLSEQDKNHMKSQLTELNSVKHGLDNTKTSQQSKI
jgi:hypothetical protein